MHKTYTWEYRIDLSPYDKLVGVVEAFFCTYPAGDYTCEHREAYKLRFRRGAWRKSLLGLGRWVPVALAKGHFNQWPLVVHALIRPSPQTYRVMIRYELSLPDGVRDLQPEVQTSVAQYVRRELEELSGYLAECAGQPTPPEVVAM